MHRLLEFQERAVRDLAWVLLGPPMVQASASDVACATASWCTEQFEDFHGHLQALQRDPSPLLQSLGDPTHLKLGKYFENLIAYWLQASPNFDLLARNLQVRDDKKTYGELDLIVRDLKTGRIRHWEVAAKFYLELGPPDVLNSWVGPNRRDDLGRKSRHLLRNQARRAEHPVARALLGEMGLQVDEAFVFLKGHLFYDSQGSPEPKNRPLVPSNVHLHPQHERFWWLPQTEFERTHAQSRLSWFELLKPNWLANQSGLSHHSGMRPWQANRCNGPNLVVGLADGLEIERGFVVPDDWRQIQPT